MQKNFKIGTLEVKPGETYHGMLTLADGEFEMPVSILCGKRPGRTVLITAGIQAGEYVGVQAAIDLSKHLQIEKVNGTIVIVKIVRKEEFEYRAGSFGIKDKKNLNREFPGKADGTETERLANAFVREVFSKVDCYIDLHSGNHYKKLTPYVYYAGCAKEDVVAMSRKMAEQVDVPYMVRSLVAVGGAYNYAATIGIPSILIERGEMGGWNLEEVRSTRRDVKNILCALGNYEAKRDYRQYYPLEVVDVTYQATEFTGCWYPFKNPGDMITKGEVLGEIRDYEGKLQETCYAEYDGVILFETGSLQVNAGGPVIAYGRISKAFDDRKKRITNYWTKRSESFLEQRRAELKSVLSERWMTEIKKWLPNNRKLKILDVGCGSGFFSILLAKEGHQVTGTDLTPDMIVNAKKLAKEEQVEAEFLVMDAENLEFGDETFDMIISRNLTWTLPHTEDAYQEWKRVLKPDGILLNFDANYGNEDCSDTSNLPKNHAHYTVGDELLQECEEIKKQLPISSYVRPAWDLNVLGKMGFSEFSVDLGVSQRIYIEKDEFYNPTPLFMLCAKKDS